MRIASWFSPSTFGRRITLLLLLKTSQSFGLPVNFGIHQRDIKYNQLDSRNFSVFHDARVKQEPLMILNALEGAKPVLEKWFEKDRSGKRMPVIASAVTNEASFANWILDQIELQTYGQFDRDLAWHEYTHSTMYLHFYNFFGPPGATINLIWLPSWYIEGLAETLSASVGSSTQMMLEKYHALSGEWPSFDKLHSLYTDSRWAQKGYPASGAFVRWIALKGLKKNLNDNHLVQLLKNFRRYSQPWWWPWASVPFNKFMPFDQALEDQFSQNAEKLWEEYKKEAKEFWQKNSKGALEATSPEPKLVLSGIETLHTSSDKIFLWGGGKNTNIQKKQLLFDDKTNWATRRKDIDKLIPPDSAYAFMVENEEIEVYVKAGNANSSHLQTDYLMARQVGSGEWKKITSVKTITKLIDAGERIAWLEIDMEKTSFCFLTIAQISKQINSNADQELTGNCRLQEVLPRRIEYLGQKTSKSGESNATEVWLKTQEQTLNGDHFGLLVWNAEDNKIKKLNWKSAAEPKKIAFSGDDIWALTADGITESVWKLSTSGDCIGKIQTSDYVKSIAGLSDGSLILALNSRDGYVIKKTKQKAADIKACGSPRGQLSPLLYAMRKMAIENNKTEKPQSKVIQENDINSEKSEINTNRKTLDKNSNFAEENAVTYDSNARTIPSFREAMLATDLWSLYAEDNPQQNGDSSNSDQTLNNDTAKSRAHLDRHLQSRIEGHLEPSLAEDSSRKISKLASITEKQKIEPGSQNKHKKNISNIANIVGSDHRNNEKHDNIDQKTSDSTSQESVTQSRRDETKKIENVGESDQELISAAASEKFLANTEPLNSKTLLDTLDPGFEHSSKEYHWKARPALLFPWIGGEDPFGTQLGIISIPIVDSLQNETVRTTFLWGMRSNYPAVDITATTTRFKPLISFSLFKKQTYNGSVYNQAKDMTEISYYDEIGSRIEVSDSKTLGAMQLDYQWGIRRSLMKRLYGPRLSKIGILNEPGGSIYSRYFIGRWVGSSHLAGVFTSPQLSQNFDYNKLDIGLSFGKRLGSSNLSLGLDTSRIRGKKMPLLKEMYSPLKTFIPGSGGGLNQNNFSITPTYGLLSSIQGDTQGRAKLYWTMPVIESIEKHLFIFYFDRLDFSAFYNYGGAWSQALLPPSGSRLIAAHGYNLDLQFENKGVKFTAGLGTGQIFGRPLEFFAKFSFDNYF